MTTKTRTAHVVVDGSNIATEGRSMPSLAQLNEAVLAFLEEHPGVTVTVVVDATFGHRIDKSEVKEFDAAIANNELVAPPAGAVGRGDAFVLSIANKAGATILSNDSFQEFHGQYEWLFDEGRLIGGKPVPHVGWVFVPRVPVRGPVSRKAVRDSKREPTPRSESRRGATAKALAAAAPSNRKASKEASQPLPVPSTPPPGRARVAASDTVNELMPFLEFVERHPVGTSVNAVVETYSSHGAYVKLDNVLGYVPLRLMADPPPRSAREVMRVGDAVTLVVASFAPARRSIDLAVPHMAAIVAPQDSGEVLAAAATDEIVSTRAQGGTGRSRRTAAAKAAVTEPVAVAEAAPAEVAPTRKRAAKKAAATTAPAPTPSPTAKKAAAKKAAVTAEPVPSEAPAPEPAATKAAKRAATATKPAKKAAATKAAAKPTAATKAAAKPTAAKKATATAAKAAAKEPAVATSKAAAEPAAPTPRKRSRATKAAAEPAPGDEPVSSRARARRSGRGAEAAS